jgi:hypothetical protein
MTWRLHPTQPIWMLISDGVAVESLKWDRESAQYRNSAGIAVGGNWAIAKAAMEASVEKPKKAGR